MAPLLEVVALSKRYGNVQAVQDFALTIDRGEIVGLIGPNGAGKTTVFNLISGFSHPDQGNILWHGTSIFNLSASSRAQAGLVRTFQHTRVLPTLTVFHNVLAGTHRLGKQANLQRRCEGLLERLGLRHLRDVRASDLPYGHAKLLSIGIALASEPDLLLLDEPAAGLNTQETEHLESILRQIRRPDLSLCVIEHNMPFIFGLCSRILVVNAGRLIAEGTPDEIRENAQVQDAYLGRTEEVLVDVGSS
jgi:branched-chain amino acid transport system ATP-binding protein